MRLSIARRQRRHTGHHGDWDDAGPGSCTAPCGAAWRCCIGRRAHPRLRRHPVSLRQARRRRHTVFASGQVFASVGNSTVNVYSRARATRSSRAQRRHQRALHRRQRLRLVGQLLRDRRLHRRRQRVLARRHARSASSPAGCRTRSRWPSTTRATSTSDSRPRPTSPSSPRPGRPSQNIGPLATELTGDDWIDLLERRVHLLLHDRGHATSCATTSAPTPRSPTSTSQSFPSFDSVDGPAVQAFELQILAERRRARGRLERGHPARTKTATSSRPTPAPRCRAARARSSP